MTWEGSSGPSFPKIMIDAWKELLLVVSSISAASFGLMKMLLSSQKSMNERIITALEESLKRQDTAIRGFQTAISALSDNVKENTFVTERAFEDLRLTFSKDDPPQ